MKNKYFKILALFIAFLSYLSMSAQQSTNNFNGTRHLCEMPDTGDPTDLYIGIRESVRQKLENRIAPCATINVNYIGQDWTDIFGQPNEAQNAFQLAVDIWENLIDSPVEININATYEGAAAGNLGSASATYFRAVPGDLDNVLYPAPLYEKIVGVTGNAGAADISCNFNSNRSDWFFPTSAGEPTPAGRFNFTSVVLHEIGHGLGVAGFGRTRIGSTGTTVGYIRRDQNGNTTLSANDPTAIWYNIWDEFIFNGGTPVLSISDPSSALLSAFTGDNLTCNSSVAIAENGGIPPKTYAPPSFNGGSSYSHWDESTFNGTETALMTPFLGPGETVYDPGDVTLGFMQDMGWTICDRILGINDNILSSEIKTTPNPFTESITIHLPQSLANQTFDLSIIDINGKVVFNNVMENKTEMDLSNLNNLESSIYFLKITSNTSDLSITKRIIKQ